MDRLFEEWLRSLLMRRPFGLNWDWPADADMKAAYKDGILEIRVPVAEQAAASEPTKITVSKD